MQAGPASLLAEPVPAGVLTVSAKLSPPPVAISAADILPENLPEAWKNDETTALAVATALSQKVGKVLPWKTVRDAISGTLHARFVETTGASSKWPCEFHEARSVRLKVAAGGNGGPTGGGTSKKKSLVASAYLEPPQIQDLADAVPKLLEIRAKSKVPIQFRIQVELGDGQTVPPKEMAAEVAQLLSDESDELHLT
jgi:hypothetical protein